MQLLAHLLQQQLAADDTAVANLPAVVALLTAETFAAAPQSHKLWLARVNSLIERPKQYGAKWAGLCLAARTAQLNKDLLLQSSQAWIALSLPILSRDESPPMTNAAIHLLAVLFTSVTDTPEYHRQIVTPTVQKFSIALLQLAEKPDSLASLKMLSLRTLAVLVHSHPTLHIALQQRISNLTLAHLSGSFPSPTDPLLAQAAANLHTVLHLTGGKVRAASVWRKSVDSAVASALSCINEVSTTLGSPSGSGDVNGFQLPTFDVDTPHAAVNLALDRLRSLVTLLVSLLQYPTARPVPIPIGSLASLASRLLGVDPTATDSTKNGTQFIDPQRRVLEESCAPQVWRLGCEFLSALSQCIRHHLTPHVSHLVSIVVYHLERPIPAHQRLPFLQTLSILLTNSHRQMLHSAFLPNRLIKALVPSLTRLLSQKPTAAPVDQNEGKSNRGKKKLRAFEGDEVFRTSSGAVLSTEAEGQEILLTLDLLPLLLLNPHPTPSLVSSASRLLLTLLINLPHIPASQITTTSPSLPSQILSKLTTVCERTLLTSARALPLLAISLQESEPLERTLHPKLPPILRVSAQIENTALYRAEGKEEREAREALGLVSLDDKETPVFPMYNYNPTPLAPAVPAPVESSAMDDVVQTPSASAVLPTAFAPSIGSAAAAVPTSKTVNTKSAFAPPPTFTTATPSSPITIPSSFIVPPATNGGTGTTASVSVVRPAAVDSDDEDEPMPEIDMGSDSE